jgi:uncharacterized protein (TIGR02001 family)
MRKLPKALALAGFLSIALAATLARAEDPPPSPLTWKLSLYSEYEYRGISQTSEKPAGQLNIDYAHPSGFYLGTFLSNIKWLKDTAKAGGFSTSAQVEWDLFGGYRFEPVKDLTVDVGYLRYEYPNSGAFDPKPNTDEVYIGGTYGAYNLKYSYSFNDTFGVPKSKGSTYVEFNYSRELIAKLTTNVTIARQTYKGTQSGGFKNDDLSYNVYKLGLAYDLGDGWNIGAYGKNTSAKSALYTVLDRDWSKGRLVAFVSKAF